MFYGEPTITFLCRANVETSQITSLMGKREFSSLRPTSLEDAMCPVAMSLDVIGDWWTLLIVGEAFNGAKRLGEFQKNLGLAENILSNRLAKMA
jgi:DNA-binding HxlR family transcriptional regulator